MTGLDLGVMEVRETILTATADLKPKIISKEKAVYTYEARANGVKGTVLISAVFSVDGQVGDFRVIRGLPFGLNDQAINAARKIKFKPALKDGVPVNVRMSMEFSFILLR